MYKSVFSCLLLILLTGCSVNAPDKLTQEELKQYVPIHSFVENKIGVKNDVSYGRYLSNIPGSTDVVKPYFYIKQHCEYIGGILTLDRINNSPLKDPEPLAPSNNSQLDLINSSFGIFKCMNVNDTLYIVNIDHSHSYTTSYPTLRQTTVMTSVIATKEQILIEQQSAEVTKVAAEAQRRKDEQNFTIRHNRFNNESLLAKSIGQEICSAENQFGYVEDINGNKLKIRLIGKAINKHNYYFFGELAKSKFNFKLSAVEMIWDEQLDWGKCAFKI
ncbi:hypothetical protein [Moritella viscosa]|uniref:hypothetical protein n=1 Tax=Moritella viscosa TaxID=80854 RepID=UPI0009236D9D|nr:hypothetical protein [Moritella viscosa]SGY81451.1 SpoVR family protein [Moritella viscosa]